MVEHKGHDTVTAAAERTERQRELEVSLQNIQQRIQDRESDVKLLQQEVEAINASADKAVEDSETVFSELIQQMEKRRHDVKQQVRSQQEAERIQDRESDVKLLQQEVEAINASADKAVEDSETVFSELIQQMEKRRRDVKQQVRSQQEAERIQDRESDVKLLQQEVEAINASADKAVEDSETVFTELIQQMEKRRRDVKQQVRSQQEAESWSEVVVRGREKNPGCTPKQLDPSPAMAVASDTDAADNLAPMLTGDGAASSSATLPVLRTSVVVSPESPGPPAVENTSTAAAMEPPVSTAELAGSRPSLDTVVKPTTPLTCSIPRTLQENVCPRHDEVMKIFCRTDGQCICYLCSVDEHKGHDTVTAAAERTERQRELEVSLQNIQQRIQDRESDVKLLQQEVEAINASADKAVEDSETVFSELIQHMEKRRRDVKQQVRSQQEAEVSGVAERQEQLEQEISHDTVTAAAERTERQRELEVSLQNIQQRIQDRESDVKLLQQEVEAINASADKAVEDSETVFTELIQQMEKRRCDVKQQVRSQQEAEEFSEVFFPSGANPYFILQQGFPIFGAEEIEALLNVHCGVDEAVVCPTIIRTGHGPGDVNILAISGHDNRVVNEMPVLWLHPACQENACHDTVTAAAERTERQRELEVSLQNIQQRIQDRESDVKLLQQEVEAINASADKAVEDSETVFSELIQQMEKRRRDVKQQVRSQQEAERIQDRESDVKLLQQEVEAINASADKAVEDSETVFTELIQQMEKRRCDVKQQVRSQQEAERIQDRESDVKLLQQEVEAINASADKAVEDSETVFSELIQQMEKRRRDVKQQVRSQQEAERIQDRESDVKLLQQEVEAINASADKAVEDSETVFTELIQQMEKRRRDVKQQVRSQQEAEEFSEVFFPSGANPYFILQQGFPIFGAEEIEALRIQDRESDVKLLQQEVEAINASADKAVEDSETVFTKLIQQMEKRRRDVKQQVRSQQEAERIQDRESDVKLLQQEVEAINASADKAVEDSETVFTELIQQMEKRRRDVKQQVRSQQEAERIQDRESDVKLLQQEVEAINASADKAVEDSETVFSELIQQMEKRRRDVKQQVRSQQEAELSMG
ncbi:uncharacterized protein V6R79_003799 [Siganus canaliculatus]